MDCLANNLLIHGDNIKAMRHLLDKRGLAGKVDLVYIDPPFATNCRFKIADGRVSTMSQQLEGETAYTDFLQGKEFVEFIRERLILLKELMSERASIYLHTDYKVGHYLKVLMDEVFGQKNFRNDITRIKCNSKNFPHIGYGNIKDMILFYTKCDCPIWNEPKERYSPEDIVRLFPKVAKDGRRYTTNPINAPGESRNPKMFKGLLPPKGRHWCVDVETLEQWDRDGKIEWSANGNPRKIMYADESDGKRVNDIWTDFKDPQYPVYPTEKNASMLDRIILTSSNRDSIVLDCFCGSGTTLSAAERNGRRWIGIDESDAAIRAVRKKLGIGSELLSQQVEEIAI